MREHVIIIYFFTFLYSRKCELIPCYSEQDEKTFSMSCSVDLYQGENCSNTRLSEHYPDLYDQEYWPDRPNNLQLIPIQIEWPSDYPKYLLPGFTAKIQPPQTVSIRYTKGFQLDFVEETTRIYKCLIVQINGTLTSDHRENHISFAVELRLKPKTTFKFTAWSLPKPPISNNNTNVIIHGQTGINDHILNPSQSADWVTTISYQNNVADKNIKIWFAPAPVPFNILEYNVTLEQVVKNEGTDTEHRITIFNNRTSQTHQIFNNVRPGRYRVTVIPYDDKWDTLSDCKCKNEVGCASCMRTITSVIVVPEENPPTTQLVPGKNVTILAITTDQTHNVTIHAVTTDQTHNVTVYKITTDQPHILPSILGFVALLLVVVVIVSCYKFHRQTDLRPGKTTVAIFSTTEEESHNKVVHCFISYLQKVFHLNVLYYAWIFDDDKFVIDSLEQSDYVVFVIPQVTHHKHIKCLQLVNHLNGSVKKKLIMIKFDHTKDVSIEGIDGTYIKQFLLMKDLKHFLYYIHGVKFSWIKGIKHSIDTDVLASSEGQRLTAAIKQAEILYRSNSSDSGYPEEVDQISLVSAVTINKHCQRECCCTKNHLSCDDYEFYPPTEVDSTDRMSEILNQEIHELNNRNMNNTEHVKDFRYTFVFNDSDGCEYLDGFSV